MLCLTFFSRIEIDRGNQYSFTLTNPRMKNLSHTATEPPGLLRKLGVLAATMILLGFAAVFSLLVLALALTAGGIALGYIWWKTRELRKQLRKHPPGGAVMEGEILKGEVIEGEVIREADSRDRK